MGEMMATIDLDGDWGTLTIQQNGTQVTAIATVANPHFKRGDGVLVGDVLQMTSTGGQYVQAYTGKVSPNGARLLGPTVPPGGDERRHRPTALTSLVAQRSVRLSQTAKQLDRPVDGSECTQQAGKFYSLFRGADYRKCTDRRLLMIASDLHHSP
jgi:hypothetical protein